LICMVCGDAEDNGWSWGDNKKERCERALEVYGKAHCDRKTQKSFQFPSYCGPDVCDNCWKNTPKAYDKYFFQRKRNKTERREYFAHMYKKKNGEC
jgi:hypothetical protein